MSNENEESTEETTNKTTLLNKIDFFLKWIVFGYLLLCIASGGISCAGKDFHLENCNPNAGIEFDEDFDSAYDL